MAAYYRRTLSSVHCASSGARLYSIQGRNPGTCSTCCVTRLWQALRKSKFLFRHVSYLFNWREIWGSCRPGQFYTTKSTLRHRCRMWTCVVLLKSTSTSCRRNDSSAGLTTCSMYQALFILLCRNTKCNRKLYLTTPHTMKPEVGAVCCGRMHSGI